MTARRRWMFWLLIPASAYVGLVALLWALQDRLIFVAAGGGGGGPLPELPGVTVERLPLPGVGGTFRVAVAEPAGAPRGAVVGFVGNGETLQSGVRWAGLWADYGQRAVVVEFPGYGDSDGVPGKATFFAAAEAAARFARERAGGLPLTAAGSSLGSFCAVHLAAAGLVDRLLLRSPPASLERAAQDRFPWLPVGMILRHEFDNVALAARVRCPALVIHGDRDSVVPLAHGESLAAAFAVPAAVVVARGYGHNDLPVDRRGPFGARIAAFLGAN